MRNTFLVTYDICEERRLAKVHKIMRGFGDHLQYSVFECQLTQAIWRAVDNACRKSSTTRRTRYCSSISAPPRDAAIA
jgi:CRISPR-associated endonuclease Cas2